MSLKDIKQQQITLLNENLFEKEQKNEKNNRKTRLKKEEEKQKHCVSMYFTDSEYNELLNAKGDVSQSLFCKKIVLSLINK